MRSIYRCVLLLHPTLFRTRFQEEMLWIFEAAGRDDRWWLIRDAVLSLFRQRLLRPRNYSVSLHRLSPVLHMTAPLVMAATLLFCVYAFALSILLGPLGMTKIMTLPAICTVGVLSIGIYRSLSLPRMNSRLHVWVNPR